MNFKDTQIFPFEEFSEVYQTTDRKLYFHFWKKFHNLIKKRTTDEFTIKSFTPWVANTDRFGNIRVGFEGETDKNGKRGRIGGLIVYLNNLNSFRGHLFYQDSIYINEYKSEAETNKPTNKTKIADLIELKEHFKTKRLYIAKDFPINSYNALIKNFFEILKETGLIKYNHRFEQKSFINIDKMSLPENIKGADITMLSEILSAWWIIYNGHALSLYSYLSSGSFDCLLDRLEEVFDKIEDYEIIRPPNTT